METLSINSNTSNSFINNSSLSIPLTAQDTSFTHSRTSKHHHNSPPQVNYTQSNIFSLLTFWWSRLAMRLSNQGKLRIKDISPLAASQRTDKYIQELYTIWQHYIKINKHKTYPLFFALFHMHFWTIVILFIFDFCLMGFDYVVMYFFRQVVQHFSSGDFNNESKKFLTNVYNALALLVLCRMLRTFMFHHLNFRNEMLSERITNELTALIYNKILKLNTNLNESSKEEGEKLTLVEEDAEKIGFVFHIGPKIITGPIKVCISLSLLFKLFGFYFVNAVTILVILILVVVVLQVCFLKNLKQLLHKKDSRLKIVTSTFHMLKSIKLNGWDNEFTRRIKVKRDDELKYFIRNQNIQVSRDFITSNLPLALLIVTLGSYAYLGKELETSNLFTGIQLINQVTMPLLGIPMVWTGFFANLISIKRIQRLLLSKEHNYNTNYDMKAYEEGNVQIKITNTDFGIYYNKKNKVLQVNKHNLNESIEEIVTFEQGNNTTHNVVHSSNDNNSDSNDTTLDKLVLLKHISLTVNKGEFIGVLGATGSGKSCLIKALLNNYEVFYNEQPIIVNGTLSFAAQQPWIMNDTVKNNILFFNEYNEDKYRRVLEACQLVKDLDELPKADETIISSSGGNVSGGQRARISLARCLYKDASMYILDDPLSSIDAKVAHNIFIGAFCELLKGKTRIVVTNEVSNMSCFDKIVLMEKGTIAFVGTFSEFKRRYGAKYANEIQSSTKENDVNNSKDNNNNSNNKDVNGVNGSDNDNDNNNLDLLLNNNKLTNLKHNLSSSAAKKKQSFSEGINLSLYKKYINLQGGICVFLVIMILIISSQVCNVYREITMTSWSKSMKEIKHTTNIDEPPSSSSSSNTRDIFYIYLRISLMGIAINIIREFIITRITINSLKKLHEIMIQNLIKAPINLFHDLIPIGQILNRLTKDLELVQRIIRVMTMFSRSSLGLITTVYVCFKYNKYSLILSPILIFIGIFLTRYYIGTARNLQRFHRITYSPILTILSESIKGVETIRTAKAENHLTHKLYKRLDDHFGVHLYIEGAGKWYRLCFILISHIFFGIVVSYLIYDKENVTVQAIGLIMNYASMLNEQLIQTMNEYSHLEVSMICLERCDAYTALPSEKEGGLVIKNNNNNNNTSNKGILHEQGSTMSYHNKKLSTNINYITWPTMGKIRFINFSARYRTNTPIILKNINLDINAKEKVGIVGRTGCGKSSLVLSLCRIIEGLEGVIEIDGVDIRKINLSSLRQNISVVPQDPFILEGTLRENLDPMNNMTDNDIISILNDFCLFTNIENPYGRLNMKIKENGTNLSIGEKQLICFARAALKKCKIVILDEATASIDIHTERILKKNIQTYFNDSTVIIIAHHIQMVSECEKIIVIDEGKVIESDTYNNLLNNKSSKFYELYAETLLS